MKRIKTYRPKPFLILFGLLILWIIYYEPVMELYKNLRVMTVTAIMFALIKFIISLIIIYIFGYFVLRRVDIGKRITVYDTHIEVVKKQYPINTFKGFNENDEFVFVDDDGKEIVSVRWKDYPKNTKNDIIKIISQFQDIDISKEI